MSDPEDDYHDTSSAQLLVEGLIRCLVSSESREYSKTQEAQTADPKTSAILRMIEHSHRAGTIGALEELLLLEVSSPLQQRYRGGEAQENRSVIPASLSDIVTKFMLDTCRVDRSKPNMRAVYATFRCAETIQHTRVHHRPCSARERLKQFPQSTGSVAEIYIEPLMPCIGDMDTMFYYNTDLAIPSGFPVPTELPAEFAVENVTVYELRPDCLFPGYVDLHPRCDMQKDARQTLGSGDKHNCCFVVREEFTDDSQRISSKLFHEGIAVPIFRGPAISSTPVGFTHFFEGRLSHDDVYCIRCLAWPPQANKWQTRRRKHGWPTSADIESIVASGCDVVGSTHPGRVGNTDTDNQWRLSFSRAEVVLLNSWSPVQQIIYHMLRYFIKSGFVNECQASDGSKIWTNYNLKTLMMWAVELGSASWWNANLPELCRKLLHTAALWVAKADFKHYFVSKSNLYYRGTEARLLSYLHLAIQFSKLTEQDISTWFIFNYIKECCKTCPFPELEKKFLFTDSDIASVDEAVRSVSRCCPVMLKRREYEFFDDALGFFAFSFNPIESLSGHLAAYDCYKTEISRIDVRALHGLEGAFVLSIASRIRYDRHSCDSFVDIINAILSRILHIRSKLTCLSAPELYDTCRVLLATPAENESKSTRILRYELAVICRCKALECHGFRYSDGMRPDSLEVLAESSGNMGIFELAREVSKPIGNNNIMNGLYEALVQVAVERLTVYREIQHDAYDTPAIVPLTLGDLGTITTMFHTLWDYSRGDHLSCLADCWTPEVIRLSYTCKTSCIPIPPAFYPLVDDQLIALRGLVYLVNRDEKKFFRLISEIAFLRLAAICTIKCRQLVPTRRLTTGIMMRMNDYAHFGLPERWIYDHATLKFVYRWFRLQLRRSPRP